MPERAPSSAPAERSDAAVLLVQLGGPERREELEPFLYALFSDPEVLRIPIAPLRKMLARTIARRRAPQSAAIYEAIGWSPIRRLTERQRASLAAELAARAAASDSGPAPSVYAGMTCSAPSVESALAAMKRDGIRRVLILPLYPQYSYTTTRSSLHCVRDDSRRLGFDASFTMVEAFYDEDGFLAAHAERVRQAASALPDPDPSRVHLLYSAHSLPKALVEKRGDPYRDQVEATVKLVNERLGNAFPWSLAYQSKVGPVEWLGPSTEETIRRLGAEGVRQLIVSPIAFVTEHVETLYEIAILFAGVARQAGIPHFRPVAALDDHPDLIRALADVALRCLPAH